MILAAIDPGLIALFVAIIGTAGGAGGVYATNASKMKVLFDENDRRGDQINKMMDKEAVLQSEIIELKGRVSRLEHEKALQAQLLESKDRELALKEGEVEMWKRIAGRS